MKVFLRSNTRDYNRQNISFCINESKGIYKEWDENTLSQLLYVGSPYFIGKVYDFYFTCIVCFYR